MTQSTSDKTPPRWLRPAFAAAALSAAVVVLVAGVPGLGPAGADPKSVLPGLAADEPPAEPQVVTVPGADDGDRPPDTANVIVARADVDGDGRRDEAELVIRPEPDVALVRVTLATGKTSTTEAGYGEPPKFFQLVDLNRDGRVEPLTERYVNSHHELDVYTWHRGELVKASVAGDPGINRVIDSRGRYSDYFLDDAGLHSWVRRKPVGSDARTFEVDVWTWTLDGGRLEASRGFMGCVDVASSEIPKLCES